MGGGQRRLVPALGRDDARGTERLHHKRMFAIGARQSVRPIIIYRQQFIQFVIAEALARQSAHAECQAGDDKHAQSGDQDLAAEGGLIFE